MRAFRLLSASAALLSAGWLAAGQEEGCVLDDDGEAICPQKALSAIQKRASSQRGLAAEEGEQKAASWGSEIVKVQSLTSGRSHVAEVVVHGGSEAHLEGGGVWVITVPDGCTDADVARMAEHMPEGSEAVFSGHPSEGGLCTFQMKGTKAMVMEELHSHSWPSNITVETDRSYEIIPELPEEAGASMVQEQGSLPWGLDRIDGRGLDGSYDVQDDLKDGEGVHVYVMDTGVRTTHEDFEDRAWPTLDTTVRPNKVCDKKDSTCAFDRQGHGTHCAATIGGKQFGVAKKSTIRAVKVMSDNGGGSFSWVMSAMDWILANGDRPAIMSMSLGAKGVRVRSIEIAIEKSTNKGVAVVVAAGNHNNDACTNSPAGASAAITVGATSSDDKKASFSSWGSCVDIWAPGVSVNAASHKDDKSATRKSGTSMACPHVAGALALLYVKFPSMVGKEMEEKILGTSAIGPVKNLKEKDNNNFLQVGVPKEKHIHILLAETGKNSTA